LVVLKIVVGGNIYRHVTVRSNLQFLISYTNTAQEAVAA